MCTLNHFSSWCIADAIEKTITDDCKICYTCTKCTNEADIYSLDCPHHNWNYCSKTPLVNESCRLCDANRNYHLKMQGY